MTDITSTPDAGGAEPGGDVLVDTGEHHHLAGAGVIKPGYAPRLTNEDLAPLKKQTWGSYNFFAFWMSDVHSVGGYVTAGSLFALGLAAWRVLVALLVGITIVYSLCNLVARPVRQPARRIRWRPAFPSGCWARTSRRSSAG